MGMRLNSPAFKHGEKLAERFSCDGVNISPPLSWSEAPQGTHSFALFCDDPDAPGGVFHHWAVYDIPKSAHDLPEGFPSAVMLGLIRQGVNDFGKVGYGGACPPKGHGPHHYRFTLMALDVGHLQVRGTRCEDIETAARSHSLAETELMGTYSR
jgi:Raf kinase inhibitor-like YbhB/YbcL family protein